MPYEIGHSRREVREAVVVARCADARAAWEFVKNLEQRGETVRYIRAPWDGQIDPDELRMNAEDEARSANG